MQHHVYSLYDEPKLEEKAHSFSLFYVAPLCNVACYLQAEEIQSVLVYKLDMHLHWHMPNDFSTYRRAKADHTSSQDL